MRILFLGDLLGRPGREAAITALPRLRETLDCDAVVVNAENAAAGYGLTRVIARALFDAGADALTLGNHAFDQREILEWIDAEPRVIRPLNWPRTPGLGANLIDVAGGRKLLVTNVLGRIFMNPVDDPFSALDGLLRQYPLGSTADAVLVDFHGEATSESMAIGHWCDGRASLVVGTHTHVPTADAMILPKGTAYQTDAGMCGVYDSIIGMEKIEPMKRFITGMGGRAAPASGQASVCGVFVVTDDATGLARSIHPIREGGPLLAAQVPSGV
ncbi:MAG: YmdB family metallophosphoesterase [Neomegalonema sp.]|nr:YmdB family metallophosphoesterase [Neomegalonema sp.]